MRVYKFLDEEFGLKTLRERKVKISTLDDLNDPFELLPYDIRDKNLRRVLQNTRNTVARNRGMLCFSAGWRDPVIWAHYARKHHGFCLGFEVPDETCKRVRYVSRRLTFPRVPGPADSDALLFTKYANWAYEEEIRIWAALNEKEDDLYFSKFGDHLRLFKVIAGARCLIPEKVIKETLGTSADEMTLIKARAGFGKFEVVKNERGFR